MKIGKLIFLGLACGVGSLSYGQSTLSTYLGWDITDTRVESLPNAQQIYTGLALNTTIPDGEAGFSLDFGGGIVATFSVTDGDGSIRVYRNSPGTGEDGQALQFTMESLTGAPSLDLSYVALTGLELDDALITLSGTDWFAQEGGPIEPAIQWLPGETLAANNLFVDPGTYNVVGFTLTAVPEPATAALYLGTISLALVALYRRFRRN